MNKLFGTDGIRGKANEYPVEPIAMVKAGKAIGKYFMQKNSNASIVIGKDTRLSGYMIENALTAGLLSAGLDVFLVGPLPTPAVSHLIKSLNCRAGVMISASHNPAEHNGLKVFDEKGCKLSIEKEKEIEKLFKKVNYNDNSAKIGKAFRIDDARGRYIEFVKGTINNFSLKGLKIVIDCANGAAYSIAPRVFSELGAEVISMNASPNGLNINRECGALFTKKMQEEVIRQKADFGIAFDGDADRIAVCDRNGNPADGDCIMAILAEYLSGKEIIKEKKIVLTDMSNLALKKFLKNLGFEIITASVGDRNVSIAVRENRLVLGGEQSGHIIIRPYCETPDAIVTGLFIARILKEFPETKLCKIKHFPQILVNVPVKKRIPFEKIPSVNKEVNEAKNSLKEEGRVFLRYSGTENLARVMVEGKEEKKVKELAEKIALTVKKEVGA